MSNQANVDGSHTNHAKTTTHVGRSESLGMVLVGIHRRGSAEIGRHRRFGATGKKEKSLRTACHCSVHSAVHRRLSYAYSAFDLPHLPIRRACQSQECCLGKLLGKRTLVEPGLKIRMQHRKPEQRIAVSVYILLSRSTHHRGLVEHVNLEERDTAEGNGHRNGASEAPEGKRGHPPVLC